MKKISCIVFFLIWYNILFAQNVKKVWKKNIYNYTKEIEGDFLKKDFDISFIKEILQNKRILFLGESSHQTSEFHILKNSIVKYLVDSLGYSILIMERSPVASFTTKDVMFDSIDNKIVCEHLFFRDFVCEENLDLIEFVKKSNLFLMGFDVYPDAIRFYKPFIQQLFGRDEKVNYFLYADSMYISKPSSFSKIKLDSIYVDFEEQYVPSIKDKKKQLIVSKIIENRKLYFNRMPNITPDFRDSIMASNIEWICGSLFPDKRIIVWTHNIHMQKKSYSNYHTMGSLLSDTLKKQSYFLGLYAHHGQTGLDKDVVDIKQQGKNSLNNIMSSACYNICFADFSSQSFNKNNSWMFKKIRINEWSYMRTKGVPYVSFDGIILIKKTSASKLLY